MLLQARYSPQDPGPGYDIKRTTLLEINHRTTAAALSPSVNLSLKSFFYSLGLKKDILPEDQTQDGTPEYRDGHWVPGKERAPAGQLSERVSRRVRRHLVRGGDGRGCVRCDGRHAPAVQTRTRDHFVSDVQVDRRHVIHTIQGKQINTGAIMLSCLNSFSNWH